MLKLNAAQYVSHTKLTMQLISLIPSLRQMIDDTKASHYPPTNVFLIRYASISGTSVPALIPCTAITRHTKLDG